LKFFYGSLIAGSISVIWMFLDPNSPYARTYSAYSLGVFFIFAGLAHFSPSLLPMYVTLMPPLPFKTFLVYLSGIIESAFGILIFFPEYRELAAWGIFATLLAIFPANINAAVNEGPRKKLGMTQQAALIRLPFQFLFLQWAHQLTTLSFPVFLESLKTLYL